VIRGRHRKASQGESAAASDHVPEIEPTALSGVFRPPGWLRDAGMASWLLVGIALLGSSLIALAALTQAIVIPVITASIVAAVASPLVTWSTNRGLPRALGAVLMMLGIIAVAVGLFLMVFSGITAEASSIGHQLSDAKDAIGDWLKNLGIDTEKIDGAKQSASSGVSDGFSALTHGVLTGIAKLSSLVFFLALTALSLFFLLKDGPTIRAWTERHTGLPEPVARITTQRVLGSLRGYFLGVTIVAAFNAVVVVLGALILGVPLLGTIAVVTFVGAYIPYLGAWGAAAFVVLIALGSSGPEAAGGMIVVQLLANGVLQQLVQPFAMGAALGIHPLAVLIVTIAGGALFGAVGLILAGPLTSAITRISVDLARARTLPEPETQPPPAPA
jgi:predicted PurR-regulated permease PerM